MHHIEESFRILRVTIETQTTLPSVITVTSPMGGEGTTYVACGLAHAFAEAGHATLLVDANTTKPGVSAELGEGRIPRLSITTPPGDTTHGPARIAPWIAEMRAEFAVTIVDAPPMPKSSVSIEIARAADNVLLAVRLGRRLQREDRDLRKLLADFGSRVIGVVPTHAGQRRPRETDQRETLVRDENRQPASLSMLLSKKAI